MARIPSVETVVPALKILQIVSGRNVNGAVTYCKFLSEQLTRLGHRVTVLCRPDGWLQDNLPDSINIKESPLKRSPWELHRISRWIQSERFDVMHTHMSSAHLFGVIMKTMSGCPVVATAHQCSFQLHWRLNNHVIANSNYTRRYQQRVNRVAADRLSTIHCFTDLERFRRLQDRDVEIVRRQMRLSGNEFLVGVVGDVIVRKGQLYLFQAMTRIVEQVPNFKLVLLGRFNRDEPYVKRLRRIQKSEPLLTRVKWLGLRTNVQDFMGAFDLCVVPSVEEPLGLVAMEALAAGTPVVASETGGLPEVISHGNSGLLVPPRDPHALADAIIEMAQDPARRQAMGAHGKHWVFDQFDPQRLAQQVESVYRQLPAVAQAAA